MTTHDHEPLASVPTRIAAVMRAIRPIARERQTDSGPRYSYRGVDDVMNELHDLLAGQSLWTVTRETASDITQVAIEGARGPRQSFMAVHRFEVGVAGPGPDGELQEVMVGSWTQMALDVGDKATNKAWSSGWRDALLKAFCIPTEAPEVEAGDQYVATVDEWSADDEATVRSWVADHDALKDDLRIRLDDAGMAYVRLMGPVSEGYRRPTLAEGRWIVEMLADLEG